LGKPRVHLALPISTAHPARKGTGYVRLNTLSSAASKTGLTRNRTITNPVTGSPIDYYQIYINQFTQKVYPTKGDAVLVGYDGMSPGPTFLVEKGRETVVRFINNATMASAVHLHGSYSV
jgi:FtsP/CotA-like multicopper oxidase with cupredoxin domain